MRKKSSDFILLKRRNLLQETLQKKYIVGQRASSFECPIIVNGKPVRGNYKFKAGDIVEAIDKPEGSDSLPNLFEVALVAVGVATGNAALITAGVTSYAGRLLAPKNQLPSTKAQDDAKNQPELTGTSNSISKEIVPVLFGRTQITPYYGQQPYRYTGDGTASNVYYQYFVSTYGSVAVYNEKLGQTPIDSITGLDITKSFNSETFIGFENIKQVARDEQLTVDESETIDDIATSNNVAGISSGITTINFTIRFTTLSDINDFSDKTLKIYLENSVEFVISSADLTDFGTYYEYTGIENVDVGSGFDDRFVRVQNITNTQRTSIEESENLECTLTYIDIGGTNPITTTQQLNKKTGANKVVETSPKNTTSIDVGFDFPQGFFTSNSDGTRSSRSADIQVQYKAVGDKVFKDITERPVYVKDEDGNKIYLPSTETTTTASAGVVTINSPSDMLVADELFFRNIGFDVPAGQYTVRISSLGLGGKTNRDIGAITVGDINFTVEGDVVDESVLPKVGQIATIAKAYKTLSGTLQQYNFEGALTCPDWDGNNWVDAETRNPASVIRYLLTSTDANPRAESLDRLDDDSFVEFWEWCDSQNFKADGVVANKVKIQTVVENLLSNCQAQLTFLNGKYYIVIDNEKAYPQDLFTPHNSWGFQWTPAIGKTTDAIRGKYVDESDYKENEFTLYWYNDQINEEPEEGKTDRDYEIIKKDYQYIQTLSHAKALASFELKTAQVRRQSFEFQVNLEGWVRNVFDRVLIANTVNMTNESSGRIKSLTTSGGNITGFELEAPIHISNDTNYITIRSFNELGSTTDFSVQTLEINEKNTTTEFITLKTPIANNGIIKGQSDIKGINKTWFYNGDTYEVGSNRVLDCTITEVRYNAGSKTATITAVETPTTFWE